VINPLEPRAWFVAASVYRMLNRSGAASLLFSVLPRVSADAYLMPVKKNQAPPDLRYFGQSGNK
jgi:hypothetical protein